jgi:hypothetical protein
MEVSTTKFNALAFFFTILLGFFLVGCNHDSGSSSTAEYTISFVDEDINVVGSTTKLRGNVNIMAIAEELNVPLPLSLYMSDGTVATDLNNYSLTKNTCFYLFLPVNVHEITTQDNLSAINTNATTLSGKYILLEDIELNTTIGEAGVDAEGWMPIGNNSDTSNRFTGIFNGNNHTIKGLWADRSSNYVGLFGFIDEGAQIKNLAVEGEVKGNMRIGSIVGYVKNSSISNSRSIGSVSGDDEVGGIAGGIGISNITNSYSTANVKGKNVVGGIVGMVFPGSSIANSYSNGDVYGEKHNVGGIAGIVQGSSVANSYSTGNVHVDLENAGGIAGTVQNGFVTNSYSAGKISSNQKQVGGIAGNIQNSEIKNNAAINPSVDGNDIIMVNRVVGHKQDGALPQTEDNFALSNMTVNGVDFSISGTEDELNGVSKTMEVLQIEETYSNSTDNGGLGWAFGDNDTAPWQHNLTKNDFPYLYWENR